MQVLHARIYALKHGIHIMPISDNFIMTSVKLKKPRFAA